MGWRLERAGMERLTAAAAKLMMDFEPPPPPHSATAATAVIGFDPNGPV